MKIKKRRKNPIGFVTSDPNYQIFLKLFKENKLGFLNIIEFAGNFSNEIIKKSRDISDICTIFYLRGLLRGYSMIYKSSRFDAKNEMIKILSEVNIIIERYLQHHGINPEQKFKFSAYELMKLNKKDEI